MGCTKYYRPFTTTPCASIPLHIDALCAHTPASAPLCQCVPTIPCAYLTTSKPCSLCTPGLSLSPHTDALPQGSASEGEGEGETQQLCLQQWWDNQLPGKNLRVGGGVCSIYLLTGCQVEIPGVKDEYSLTPTKL